MPRAALAGWDGARVPALCCPPFGKGNQRGASEPCSSSAWGQALKKARTPPARGLSLHNVQRWGLKHFFGSEAQGCGQEERPLAVAVSPRCGRVPKRWLLQHGWDEPWGFELCSCPALCSGLTCSKHDGALASQH